MSTHDDGQRKVPERAYVVEERLVGTAIYLVVAHNKKEALAKVRNGEGGDIIDSHIDHMGTGYVRRAEDAEL